MLLTQNRKCLEEAVALKMESVKEGLRQSHSNAVSDTDVSIELLSLLQMKQDEQCRKMINVGMMV